MQPNNAPDIIAPQSKISNLINAVTTPTGTVLFSGEEINTNEYKNSFQESVNENIPAESIPGTANGTIIL